MDLTGLVVEQSSFLSNGFMQTMEHAFEQAHISIAHLCFIVLGIITLLPSFFYNYNNHSRQKSAKYYINDHDALAGLITSSGMQLAAEYLSTDKRFLTLLVKK